MAPAPLKQRALRGATWAAVGGNGAQVLSFIMFVAISRVVGPEAFGAVAVCLLLVEIVRALTSESVAVNLIARGRFDLHAFNAGFVLSFGMSLMGGIALALAAPIAAVVFHIEALRTVLPLIAPLLAINALARLFEAELTIRMEFRALAIRSLSAVILGGLVGIMIAYQGGGVHALISQQWVAAVVSLGLLALQARWRPSLGLDREVFATLARQSLILSPAGLITNMRQSVDGFAVAAFHGAAAAGFYNLAKRTRLALQLGLTSAVGRVSLPAFAHVRDDPARLASALHQAMRLTAIVCFPVFIGVAAVAPELVSVFLGPNWALAAAPMALLMISGALAIITRLNENMLLTLGKRWLIIALNAAALALLLALLATFGRQGPVVVAALVALEGTVHNVITWLVTSRCVGLKRRDCLTTVWAPMAICIAMLLLIAVLRDNGMGAALPALDRLVLFVVIGAGFYSALAWAAVRPAVYDFVSAVRAILPSLRFRGAG